jgi:hypothetical protein
MISCFGNAKEENLRCFAKPVLSKAEGLNMTDQGARSF